MSNSYRDRNINKLLGIRDPKLYCAYIKFILEKPITVGEAWTITQYMSNNEYYIEFFEHFESYAQLEIGGFMVYCSFEFETQWYGIEIYIREIIKWAREEKGILISRADIDMLGNHKEVIICQI